MPDAIMQVCSYMVADVAGEVVRTACLKMAGPRRRLTGTAVNREKWISRKKKFIEIFRYFKNSITFVLWI